MICTACLCSSIWRTRILNAIQMCRCIFLFKYGDTQSLRWCGSGRFTVRNVIIPRPERGKESGVMMRARSTVDNTVLVGDLVAMLRNRWDVDVASTAEADPGVRTSYIRLGLCERSPSKKLLAPRGTHHHLSPGTTTDLP